MNPIHYLIYLVIRLKTVGHYCKQLLYVPSDTIIHNVLDFANELFDIQLSFQHNDFLNTFISNNIISFLEEFDACQLKTCHGEQCYDQHLYDRLQQQTVIKYQRRQTIQKLKRCRQTLKRQSKLIFKSHSSLKKCTLMSWIDWSFIKTLSIILSVSIYTTNHFVSSRISVNILTSSVCSFYLYFFIDLLFINIIDDIPLFRYTKNDVFSN